MHVYESSVFGNLHELADKSPSWNQLETFIVESMRKISSEAAGNPILISTAAYRHLESHVFNYLTKIRIENTHIISVPITYSKH